MQTKGAIALIEWIIIGRFGADNVWSDAYLNNEISIEFQN